MTRPCKLLIVPGPRALFTVLFVIQSVICSAQLIPVPLERRVPASSDRTANTNGRTKAVAMNLPFWDDFSFTKLHDGKTEGAGFPINSHWEKSDNVWINAGMGINPPSRNVATLDGLNAAGTPYSSQETVNGYRDTLTSVPIDMSAAKVNPTERTTVFFSFFYQWQGNGEAPDRGDFFRVEFKNQSGEWITVMTITTKASFRRDVFYDTIMAVQGEQFFHESFQFRFRNYGRLVGPYDTWNLDYIYLNKGRGPFDVGREEGTFASEISPVFDRYRSMPYPHFKVNPQVIKPQMDVFNLFTLPNGYPMTYNFTATFNNFSGGVKNSVVYSKTDQEVKENTPNANMNPYERHRASVSLFPTPGDANPQITIPFTTAFQPSADSVTVNLRLTLDADGTGDLLANDTVSATYKLTNFYAYDDGSAEYAVVLNEPDDNIAYRFDMATDEPDLLVGFDIYVPSYSLSGTTTAVFFVMPGQDGAPARENGQDVVIATGTAPIRRSTRDRFQRILIGPIRVQGEFFIGWRGAQANSLRVGLDYSNNTVDRIYEDTDGSWKQNTRLRGGSLMIRPIFSDGNPVTGIPKETIGNLYPNPCRGSFSIPARVEKLDILSISGQSIAYTMEAQDDATMVNLHNAPAGVYILRITTNRSTFTRKIVVY